MSANAPLRLHWWKTVPNFGDAPGSLVVGLIGGREVRHVAPKKAEMFAIGSMLQVVRRAFSDPREDRPPSIWGTGLLHAVTSRGFLQNIRVALVRGPITAALLGVEHDRYGDPGLLTNEALPHHGSRTDRIGIVPHHTLVDNPELANLIASDPAYILMDPHKDVAEVCHQIASCAHILASSLHGLIVADAYGVPNTWIDPKGQSRLKDHDYAESVGQADMAVPTPLTDIDLRKTINYADHIDACRDALRQSFPAHLKAQA